ncbi:MAG: cytochrome c peroxidase [Bacteroidota bacterium]
MKTSFLLILFSSISLILVKCKSSQIDLSSNLGSVYHPIDNQSTDEKIKLGEELFFDRRLSLDESISCATCHRPGLAFTDGLEVSDGVLDRKTTRNSPSILNAAYLPTVMYDGEIPSLEMQAIVPIQEHTEMAMDMKKLIEKLRNISEYQQAAKKIFNRDFDPFVLSRSIAAYERSLISNNSDFDKFYYQKKKFALSKKAQAGFKIFSEKLYCAKCHTLPFFTTFKVENNGYTPITATDLGRFRIHSDSSDIGKFKVPSLRNVSVTAPYMHDGKLEYLEDVIDFYANGGRNVYNQSPIIQKFTLTKKEKNQLISFLESLQDF